MSESEIKSLIVSEAGYGVLSAMIPFTTKYYDNIIQTIISSISTELKKQELKKRVVAICKLISKKYQDSF